LHCTKALIQSGITTIYYDEAYRVDDFAVHLLEINAIKCVQISLGEDDE
jgi:dCMP deaminase